MVTTVETVKLNTCLNQPKPIWNAVAILYTFFGYIGGIAFVILPNSWFNSLGVVLLTHSLIFSAYLTHEFIHGTIFKNRRWNTIFGTVMLWLNGGCYYGFKALTLQHIAHHVDRVDVFTFDIAVAMRQQPSLIRQIIVLLEWLYFPIVSFWSRWRGITACWWNPEHCNEQARTTLIISIRVAVFTLLALASLKALMLYFLSYIGMITVLRWMDAYQHTYEAVSLGTPLPKRDHIHEQANTFSNLLSRRYPWLNLIFLNFGYHNAHHAVMKCPWYNLHQLHKELFQGNEACYISLRQQLSDYHQFRVTRLFAGQGLSVNEHINSTSIKFDGAVDVSFITLY
jgi:fatty acid desaturase